MRWNTTVADPFDGIETARTYLGMTIRQKSAPECISPIEFDKLGVQNHRATLECINGVNNLNLIYDGDDLDRLNRCRTQLVDPIMLVEYNGMLTVVDGAHRIVAAYLENTPIYYTVWESF